MHQPRIALRAVARGAARLSSLRHLQRAALAALSLALLAASTLTSAASAAAQDAGRAPSGVELALSGPSSVPRGRPVLYRGVAYRVRGLATLEPLPRAPIHARFIWGEHHESSSPTVDLVAGRDGRFELLMTPPRAWEGPLSLEVVIGDGDDARDFGFAMSGTSPYAILARTDRQLYEEGEPVHVWTLVRDARSLRPLAGEEVRFLVHGGPLEGTDRAVTTGADGVASVSLQLPEHAIEGSFSIEAHVGGDVHTLRTRLGTRTYERVFATLEAEPELVQPGQSATAVIHVSTSSGAPVRDASVELTVDGETHLFGTTDASGEARIAFVAPTYMTYDTSVVGLSAVVHHPAHGEMRASGLVHLAVPLALSMEATSRIGGGLVPEVDDLFYLVVTDGAGDPPPAGTEIEVAGPAVRGGRATVRTDAAGIAEVPARLPAGTWAPATDGERPTTTVLATIHGVLERTARLSIAVQPEAEVLPFVQSPLVEPGARIEVALARRPSAQRRELVVELLDGEELVAVRHLGPGEARTSFDAPMDRLGVLSVRARVVKGEDCAEGLGTVDLVLSRPPRPGFVTVTPERPRYLVGEPARVTVSGGALPAGVRAFAAVMVRDLAAHGGELPFRAFFLGRQFDEAVLAPTPQGVRVVRVALAARAAVDQAPAEVPPLLDELGLANDASYADEGGRDVLRDPFPWARELERRGVADAMRAAEQALLDALDNDALDEVTTGSGSGRRFVAGLLDDHGQETLGGGLLTVAHLEAADPAFRYEHVARRVARVRWVRLSAALARYLDPGDQASVEARMAAREPSERWLPRMVERGLVEASDLRDPWGGQFVLARVARPAFALSQYAAGLELVSPGPDGRPGTADDVRDPFARAVPQGSPYAVACGEDELMRQLALLSPYDRTLAALTEAYLRIAAEITEELIGDAVHGGVSEGALGLGLIGTGAGGGGTGYGSGYGSGSGSVRGGAAIHTRGAGAGALSGLARVLRQRFPATLLFRPSVELDANGTAVVDVALADAVTTYLVEAVMWRTDGWSWSAETRIEADREIVVEAPIPDVARTDDALELPVRVGNRGARARSLVVSVLESPELGVAASEPHAIEVGPGAAGVETIVLRPTREGEGYVRVAVATPEGEALDAIQLPLRVVARARRLRRRAELLAVREGSLTLELPAEASARGGELEIRIGEGLVIAAADPVWQAWAHQLGDPQAPEETRRGGPPSRLSGYWSERSLTDGRASVALDEIGSRVDDALTQASDPTARLSSAARALLELAPVAADLDARPRLAQRARDLVARLRGLVAENAAQVTEDAGALVLAAASLAWTAPEGEPGSLAEELVRRAERAVVTLGPDVFVASPDPLTASTLLALADARLGRRERALALVSTVSRWTEGGRTLSDLPRAYARVATSAVASHDGRARTVTVSVDGVVQVHDAADLLRVEVPTLASPGAHVVTVTLDAPALVSARAVATFGAPWPEQAVRGPFALELEGEVGALDGTSELVLVVRNATPRTLSSPVVEVDLPTGAELTASSRNLVAAACARPPDRSGDVLTLTLTPMLPGATRRIRLPLRWSVGGTLVGLGVAAYARDHEDRATVLPPRSITISSRSDGGAR
jgi:hypothetical protein